MNNLKTYIIEKLIIGNNLTKTKFTDEELIKDYSFSKGAYLKSEKEPLAQKYGVNSFKIRDIQLKILDYLKENRKTKKEFNDIDVNNFLRFDYPENKFIKALEEEPKEFVEYLLEYYKKRAKNIKYPNIPQYQSIADKYILKKIKNIQKYLDTK